MIHVFDVCQCHERSYPMNHEESHASSAACRSTATTHGRDGAVRARVRRRDLVACQPELAAAAPHARAAEGAAESPDGMLEPAAATPQAGVDDRRNAGGNVDTGLVPPNVAANLQPAKEPRQTSTSERPMGLAAEEEMPFPLPKRQRRDGSGTEGAMRFLNSCIASKTKAGRPVKDVQTDGASILKRIDNRHQSVATQMPQWDTFTRKMAVLGLMIYR